MYWLASLAVCGEVEHQEQVHDGSFPESYHSPPSSNFLQGIWVNLVSFLVKMLVKLPYFDHPLVIFSKKMSSGIYKMSAFQRTFTCFHLPRFANISPWVMEKQMVPTPSGHSSGGSRHKPQAHTTGCKTSRYKSCVMNTVV
jgi:hypothetical protein